MVDQMNQTSQQHFPLLYGFTEVIIGNDYAAQVVAHGQVLAEREDDGWWLYGVHPGAIAEGAATLMEAVLGFRNRFKAVLTDYAQAAKDFDSFKREVEQFFSSTDAETVKEWEAARAAVREGKVDLEGVHKVTSVKPPEIRVSLLKKLAPSENMMEKVPALAA